MRPLRNEIAIYFVLAVGFLIAAGGQQIGATVVPPIQLGNVLQTTISDADLFALTVFFGFKGSETLNYGSSLRSDTQWVGTLSGSYLGTGVSVNYNGDLSTYPSVTWTTGGNYGSDAWSGSGSASATSTAAGFDMSFLYSIHVGSHVGTYTYTISAKVLPSGVVLIPFSGTEGTVIADGISVAEPHFYEFGVLDFVAQDGRIVINGLLGAPPPPAPMSIFLHTAPEPSSLLLMVGAITGLLVVCRKMLPS